MYYALRYSFAIIRTGGRTVHKWIYSMIEYNTSVQQIWRAMNKPNNGQVVINIKLINLNFTYTIVVAIVISASYALSTSKPRENI